MKHRLILKSFQSPGDIVMLTAAVRDLHAAHPGRFQTDVRTSADAVWEHNPYLTRLDERDSEVASLDMHYPLIHQSNQRPYHFLHGYAQYLEQQLDLRIPVTQFRGDIHLSASEKSSPPLASGVAIPERFWIIVAGGKYDFTAKWWNPANYQAVVDHFQNRITFVQCGEQGHWHPRLRGTVDLVGKTSLREFIRLMYHAEGVVCPVTLAMHLAAAVESKSSAKYGRPCVVVAGGREPAHWEAYPNHQFISTNGTLACCQDGGCWKSRCQTVGDGDAKDRRELCDQPVQITSELRIAKCMDMITPEEVIRRIELYHAGGLHHYGVERQAQRDKGRNETDQQGELHRAKPNGQPRKDIAMQQAIETVRPEAASTDTRPTKAAEKKTKILITFRHGLGDAIQLTIVLQHLRHYHPDWLVDVAALPGKHTAYRGLCEHYFALDAQPTARNQYDKVFDLSWDECAKCFADCPSTKVTHCLQEVFGLTPISALCRYSISISQEATQRAQAYLAEVCGGRRREDGRFPAVLIHYQGNTSGPNKDLAHSLVEEVCEIVSSNGCVPDILDWDNRSPLIGRPGVHNPGASHPLWGNLGTGDAEALGALIESAALMIGIDSGPLHVAGATTTPTIGVWTKHHPIHYFDHAANVIHLVPGGHANLAKGHPALDYFLKHYRFQAYANLRVDLPAMLESQLTGERFEELKNKRFLRRLHSRSFTRQYYEEHQEAGLDYLGFGDWQCHYGEWLAESLALRGKRVLDVGCACGSILRGLGHAGMVVQGVDVSEYMIGLGRENWPDMANLLHVADAVNLHLYSDASWDAVHTAQVAEHWKPALVPEILREFWRVTRPGGLLVCFLDTEELFERQGRAIENEDPTHVCVKPLRWWHDVLERCGWEVCSEQYDAKLRESAGSYLRRYDWDWFIARKRELPSRRLSTEMELGYESEAIET